MNIGTKWLTFAISLLIAKLPRLTVVEDATAAPLEAAIDEGAQEEIEEDEEEKEVVLKKYM